MDRARRHWALMLRSYCETEKNDMLFRQRCYVVAERAMEHRLWSRGCPRLVVFSMLRIWFKHEHGGLKRDLWWVWLREPRRRMALMWPGEFNFEMRERARKQA